MIRQGLNEDEHCCFKCVKITLLVFHIMGLLGATIFLVVSITMLGHAGSGHEDTKPEDREHLHNMVIFAIFLFGFAIIYEIIAIAGIAKENKTIVMAYLVLAILGFAGNLFYGIQTGLFTLIIIILSAFYAYMLVKKDRTMA